MKNEEALALITQVAHLPFFLTCLSIAPIAFPGTSDLSEVSIHYSAAQFNIGGWSTTGTDRIL